MRPVFRQPPVYSLQPLSFLSQVRIKFRRPRPVEFNVLFAECGAEAFGRNARQVGVELRGKSGSGAGGLAELHHGAGQPATGRGQ